MDKAKSRIMLKGKIKWLLWLFFSVCSVTITILWWMVIEFHRDYQNIPPDHLIGNKPSHVEKLEEKGFPFSFLVLGDTTGSETAESLIEMAMRNGTPSFLILLGDFVTNPDIWNHRFFLTEMTTEIRPPFPVFLVPGNHDIDYKTGKKGDEKKKVTPEIYESLYGARNFDFIFNQCLFIICGVDLKNPTDYLNYLRNTLSKKGEAKRHIFVFIHYPPKGLADHIEGSLPIPAEEDFFSLLEVYRVTACFFGDYHGYWRGQRKGVNLIVSGGGGGRLKQSQPEWGKFHHIMKINVDQDKIAEEIITVQATIELEDLFEKWAFTTLFPALWHPLGVLYSVLVILLMASGFFIFKFLKAVWHS